MKSGPPWRPLSRSKDSACIARSPEVAAEAPRCTEHARAGLTANRRPFPTKRVSEHEVEVVLMPAEREAWG